METESGPPWSTKIAVVLREGLLPWQELNVGKDPVPLTPRKLGASLWTGPADGTAYFAMFRQPVLVLSGDGAVLQQARARALQRGLPLALFTADLFATGGDDENRAAVAAVSGPHLDLVGIALHGPKNAVDKVVKGARMHP